LLRFLGDRRRGTTSGAQGPHRSQFLAAHGGPSLLGVPRAPSRSVRRAGPLPWATTRHAPKCAFGGVRPSGPCGPAPHRAGRARGEHRVQQPPQPTRWPHLQCICCFALLCLAFRFAEPEESCGVGSRRRGHADAGVRSRGSVLGEAALARRARARTTRTTHRPGWPGALDTPTRPGTDRWLPACGSRPPAPFHNTRGVMFGLCPVPVGPAAGRRGSLCVQRWHRRVVDPRTKPARLVPARARKGADPPRRPFASCLVCLAWATCWLRLCRPV
jgi:hypothetical protein